MAAGQSWVVVAVWVAFVVWLAAVGKREDARALATFIPDCVVLVTRLARDSRVPRRRKLLLLGLIGYLALPFDLVPDFIPVAGQLDDPIIVALVLRHLVRAGVRLAYRCTRGPRRRGRSPNPTPGPQGHPHPPKARIHLSRTGAAARVRASVPEQWAA